MNDDTNASKGYHYSESARFHKEKARINAILIDKEIMDYFKGYNDRYCILIVEDDPIVHRVITGFIEKLGYKHASAYNGKEACNKYVAGHGHFDVVLMDVGLPLVDGWTACETIRAWEREHKKRAVIIGQTGYDEFGAEGCYAAGMDAVIGKPYDFGYLEKLLTILLHTNELKGLGILEE